MNDSALLTAVLIGALCGGPFWLIVFSQLSHRDSRDSRRISHIEYKLKIIARHLGIDDTSEPDPILRELWKGNKINAIKLYREQTGVGLKEAKDVIDALERGETVTLEHGNGTA